MNARPWQSDEMKLVQRIVEAYERKPPDAGAEETQTARPD